MPYHSNKELPVSVRHGLPDHAQDIYREAFNHSFEAHKSEERQKAFEHFALIGVSFSLQLLLKALNFPGNDLVFSCHLSA